MLPKPGRGIRNGGNGWSIFSAAFPRYAWIGFARPDGTVETATGHLLEGQSVAERPWFKAALKGPFVGDLHEALLLNRLLRPDGANRCGLSMSRRRSTTFMAR